jgi:hypothetical protein
MSELRNLVMYPLPQVGSTRVLCCDGVSNHSDPRIGSGCFWTPRHLASVSAAHLYTMPDPVQCRQLWI